MKVFAVIAALAVAGCAGATFNPDPLRQAALAELAYLATEADLTEDQRQTARRLCPWAAAIAEGTRIEGVEDVTGADIQAMCARL